MIGTFEEAKAAYDKHMNRTRPRGWHKIGAGCTRTAYRSPTGVVYKVGRTKSNQQEHEAFKRYRKWKSLPKQGVFIPDSSLYWVSKNSAVIAMPFIDKAHSMYCAKWDWAGKKCNCNPLSRPNRMCYNDLINWLSGRGMNDLWYDNMRHSSDGKIYVIDLGHNN